MVYVAGDLQSNARVRLLDLLCEGPIEGLADGFKSIYLNETPVQNADGTYNFKLNETGKVQTTLGTGTQGALDGFPSAENYNVVGLDVTAASGGHTISLASGYDSVRVTVQFPNGLMHQMTDTGHLNGSTCRYKFQLKKGAGSFVTVVDHTVDGRAQSSYEVEHEIALDPAGTYDLKMIRVTADSGSVNLIDATTWKDYTLVHQEKLRYPFSALVGMDLDAKSFANVPRRAYDIKGLQVQVPSNYNPLTRVYTGTWDGTFITAWTDNPAWCFYDLCTNARYGLGRYLSSTQVDKWALYDIGVLCDELVADGFGGTEPRFTCNLYLQTREEAFKVLSNLASIFRGMVYWSSGTVTAVSDAPVDPIYLFNRANVVDGMFHYQGSSRKARHNVALVGWNDPDDGYKSKIEYVEDADGIALDGIQQTNVVAFGCTSRGQAHRAGRWLILSEQLETDTVSFRAGMEGAYLHPGDIVRIQDASRAGARLGGRIGAGSTTTSVVLDQGFTLGAGAYTLHCLMADGSIESKALSGVAGTTATTAAFSAAPAENTIWIATSDADPVHLYRLLSVVEAEPHLYDITALQHDPSLFATVDDDTILNTPPGGDPNPTPASLGAPTDLALASNTYLDTDGTAKYKLIGSWTQVTGADGYEVQWRPASGDWTVLPNVASPGTQVYAVDAGDYAMRVRAFNASKQSIWITATASITAETADDYLTPQEKREGKAEWDQIIAGQSGLDTAADAAGVSRSTYDTAVTALTTYLDALLDPDGTDAWGSGNWLDYTLTLYLGAGGGVTYRSKFYAVYQAADALRSAIAQAGLAPSDTFRPSALWDFGPAEPTGFSVLTTSASPSPDDQTARRWGVGQGRFTGFTLADRDAYVVLARVRLNAGATWVGKCWYSNDGSSFPAYKTLSAPTTGSWMIVAWDLRAPTSGSTVIGTGNVQAYQLELVSAGSCDVDWVGAGVYGAGSKADYENALYLSILGALASGNVTRLGTTVISNGGNLIPNPKSELTSSTLPSGSFGLVALDSTGLGYNSSTGSRKVNAGVTETITGRIECKAGESYFVTAQARQTTGTGTTAIQVETFTIAGASQGNVTLTGTASTSSTTYTLLSAQALMPANAASFVVKLNKTSGTYALFDELGCLRCADAALLVNGTVDAVHLKAGSVQTYHLSVGPNYQFRATAGGSPLLINNDGTMSANTVNGATENANDAAVYMDDQRLYSGTKSKTFEAVFTGTQARGFLINMTSAFATTSQNGLLILHSGTSLAVYGASGVGNYSAALATATVATAGTEKFTVIHSEASGTSHPRRLVIKLDGTEALVVSDATLGATYNGQRSGYAGLVLGTSGVRPGDVKVMDVGMGRGWVSIQDGVVTADTLAADLALVNVIRSTNYAAGSTGNAPTGFKLSGTVFSTTYKDGTTDANCQAEFGGSVNIGGRKAATLGQILDARNVVANPYFYQTLAGWDTSSGGITWSSNTYAAGSGSAVHQQEQLGAGSSTSTNSISQPFQVIKPDSTTPIYVTLRSGWESSYTGGGLSGTGTINVYLFNFQNGTETLIGGPWTNTGSATNDTLAWTSRTGSVNVVPLLSSGWGSYILRVEMYNSAQVAVAGSRLAISYVDEVSLII